MFVLFLKLLIGHVLVDFTMQPTAMAKGKNRKYRLQDLSGGGHYFPHWLYWLTSHALIHGGAVWLITGDMKMGILEICLHWIIDLAKCENWTNIHVDQLLHVICKVAYAIIITKKIALPLLDLLH